MAVVEDTPSVVAVVLRQGGEGHSEGHVAQRGTTEALLPPGVAEVAEKQGTTSVERTV